MMRVFNLRRRKECRRKRRFRRAVQRFEDASAVIAASNVAVDEQMLADDEMQIVASPLKDWQTGD